MQRWVDLGMTALQVGCRYDWVGYSEIILNSDVLCPAHGVAGNLSEASKRKSGKSGSRQSLDNDNRRLRDNYFRRPQTSIPWFFVEDSALCPC